MSHWHPWYVSKDGIWRDDRGEKSEWGMKANWSWRKQENRVEGSHHGALSRDLGNERRRQPAKVVLVALHKLRQVVEERSVVNAHPFFPIVTVKL